MHDIILVDKEDNQVGTGEKIDVHKRGILHRAFSIFIFNDKDELMIQKRAKGKYHSELLWTNTCCGHPYPNENTDNAAHRRLKEEMGFDTKLEKVFSFLYKHTFDNGLTEHEFDHVFMGTYNKNPRLNPNEAESYKWISIEELEEDIKNNPNRYSYWIKIIMKKIVPEIKS